MLSNNIGGLIMESQIGYSQITMRDKYRKSCCPQRKKNLIHLREFIAQKTLTDFAREIGIVKSNLSEIEDGKRDLSIGNIHSYKTYFQENFDLTISVDFLLGYTDIVENQSMDIANDLGLVNDTISTLKKVKGYWDSQENDTLNYVMKNPDLFLEFLYWLSIYIDNKYTIPLAHDKEKGDFPCNNALGGIVLGQKIKDNKGNDGYNMIGIGIDILESHAMIKMQEIINTWKQSKEHESK